MSNKLTMIELFSGIGAQEKAMRNIGIPYQVIHTCDCDKDAMLSYVAMRFDIEKEMSNFCFPTQEQMIEELQSKNIGYDFKKNKHTITSRTPINKLKQYYVAYKLSNNLGDIGEVAELPCVDLVTYSFPCFVPGTMVLTNNGYKNIENIQVGDLVLTHTNTYQKVVKPMRNYCNSNVYKINAMCSDPIYATEEHPFYVRKRFRKWNNEKRMYERKFANPEWIKAKDLTRDHYVGVAINQQSEIPKWDGMVFNWSDGRGSRYSNKLGQYMDKEDFWWIIGRYIGDGWLTDGYGKNPSYGIKICCAHQETNEITDVLDRLNIHYAIAKEKVINKIHLSMKELYHFCLPFGRGAANKRLTSTILNLPVHLLCSFLDGYISADGSIVKARQLHRATSVSRELIYGLGQCVAKAYNTPFSVYKTKRPSTCVIEGRAVNQKDSYGITFKTDKRKQDKAFYEDGYIWCPIKDISIEEYNGYVYNMEVENDNSYVVQNIIVHNCTDLSVAGKGEGMTLKCDCCGHSWPIDFNNVGESTSCPNCGHTTASSTRSGLLAEVQRLLNVSHQNNTLPRYLVLENVKNLIGKQFKPQFDSWLQWLDSIGYNTYYDVLNSKHYGVPQNRERIFAISIRKDIDDNTFHFPEKIPLTIRLKDILEKNVAEKYYISNEKVDQIVQSQEFKKSVAQLNNNPFIVASRGRNPENPSDRTVGAPTEQRLEPNMSGTTNCLTSVQKDNYVCEPIVYDDYNSRISADQSAINTLTTNCGASAIRNGVKIIERSVMQDVTTIKVRNQATEFAGCTDIAGTLLARDYKGFGNQEMVAVVEEQTDKIISVGQVSSDGSQSGKVYDTNGVFPTICACTHGYAIGNILEENISYRIRKLTPLECWRLMGFSDEDCCSANEYVSDTALYKQAGNSIVVNVLEGIFRSLFIND